LRLRFEAYCVQRNLSKNIGFVFRIVEMGLRNLRFS